MKQQPVISTTRKTSCLFASRKDAARRYARRMVLCLGDLPQSAVMERFFQERGWKVLMAASGQDVRQLVKKCEVSVVVIAEEQKELESGWLTCWKLLNEKPETDVIIVGNRAIEQGARFAHFVGARAYVAAEDSPSTISRLLHCSEWSAI